MPFQVCDQYCKVMKAPSINARRHIMHTHGQTASNDWPSYAWPGFATVAVSWSDVWNVCLQTSRSSMCPSSSTLCTRHHHHPWSTRRRMCSRPLPRRRMYRMSRMYRKCLAVAPAQQQPPPPLQLLHLGPQLPQLLQLAPQLHQQPQQGVTEKLSVSASICLNAADLDMPAARQLEGGARRRNTIWSMHGPHQCGTIDIMTLSRYSFQDGCTSSDFT